MKSYDELKAESLTTDKMLNKKYSHFIQGNSVDLCVPNLRAIEDDGWTDWLNNIAELQATHHGLFPNHRSAQEDFLTSLANDRSKIVLMICEKNQIQRLVLFRCKTLVFNLSLLKLLSAHLNRIPNIKIHFRHWRLWPLSPSMDLMNLV